MIFVKHCWQLAQGACVALFLMQAVCALAGGFMPLRFGVAFADAWGVCGSANNLFMSAKNGNGEIRAVSGAYANEAANKMSRTDAWRHFFCTSRGVSAVVGPLLISALGVVCAWVAGYEDLMRIDNIVLFWALCLVLVIYIVQVTAGLTLSMVVADFASMHGILKLEWRKTGMLKLEGLVRVNTIADCLKHPFYPSWLRILYACFASWRAYAVSHGILIAVMLWLLMWCYPEFFAVFGGKEIQ